MSSSQWHFIFVIGYVNQNQTCVICHLIFFFSSFYENNNGFRGSKNHHKHFIRWAWFSWGWHAYICQIVSHLSTTKSKALFSSVISFNLIQCIKSKINNTPCPNKSLCIEIKNIYVMREARENALYYLKWIKQFLKDNTTRCKQLTLPRMKFLWQIDLIWIFNFQSRFKLWFEEIDKKI